MPPKDKSSATSSQTSRPEEKKLSEYLQYSLFDDPSPESSKRVTIIEDRHTISTSSPKLQSTIWALVKKDSAHTVEKEHNQILAHIVVYKKGDDNSLKSIKLEIPRRMLGELETTVDGRPNYTEEVKKAIFESEKEVVMRALVQKIEISSNEYGELSREYNSLDHQVNRLVNEKSDLTGSRGFYGKKDIVINASTLIATNTVKDKQHEDSVAEIEGLGIKKEDFTNNDALKSEIIRRINYRIQEIDCEKDALKANNPEYARWANGDKDRREKDLEDLQVAFLLDCIQS